MAQVMRSNFFDCETVGDVVDLADVYLGNFPEDLGATLKRAKVPMLKAKTVQSI